MRLIRACFAVLLCVLTVRVAAENHVVLITIDGFPATSFTDPLSPIPTIRRLAAEGVAGDGMRPSNPSVTWPNHTTLITGLRPAKHSVLFNGVLERPGVGQPVRVDPRRTRHQLVTGPTIFDLFHKAGLRTAGINWPCTRDDQSVHDNFPDVNDNFDYTTLRLREELVAMGSIKENSDRAFRSLSGAARDQVWTDAVCHVVKARKPQFIAWHILVTDSIHHKYGPQTPASHTALAQADAQVRELLRALDEAGIRKNTTILIVADHGFATANKLIQPNVALKKAGLLKADVLKVVTAKAQAVSEGGTALVYFTDPATRSQDVEAAKGALKEIEGIAEVIEPSRYAEFGYPDPAKNPQMAELVLSAKPGYAFANTLTGDQEVIPTTPNVHNVGYHGFLSTNPAMNTVFVASGNRIRKGAKQPVFENVDIAPTIAHLLGHTLPDSDGKVLGGIIE